MGSEPVTIVVVFELTQELEGVGWPHVARP
jgi:hypothetical protein